MAAALYGFWRGSDWERWQASSTLHVQEAKPGRYCARAEEGREYVRNRAREAREQAAQWADRGREVVNSQKEQFRAAYEAGRQAYHEATTETGTGKNL